MSPSINGLFVVFIFKKVRILLFQQVKLVHKNPCCPTCTVICSGSWPFVLLVSQTNADLDQHLVSLSLSKRHLLVETHFLFPKYFSFFRESFYIPKILVKIQEIASPKAYFSTTLLRFISKQCCAEWDSEVKTESKTRVKLHQICCTSPNARFYQK